MQTETKTKIIGYVGVDSGTVLIGDPSYYVGKTGETTVCNEAFPDGWEQLCNEHITPKNNQLYYALGHKGLGVVSETLDGDGLFPVVAHYAFGDTRPFKIEILFDREKE